MCNNNLSHSTENGGWRKRRGKFIQYERKFNAQKTTVDIPMTEQEFREDSVIYVGRLRTCFENLKQGMIPGSDITIQLDFNAPEFSVWSPVGTPVQYMLEIRSVRLYMPVAQLNEKLHTYLHNALQEEAALYYYREMRCVTHPISKGERNYESPELILPNSATLKLYIGLVKRSAFLGHQNENP